MGGDYGSVKDEFLVIESRRGWQLIFMEIQQKSISYSILESKKLANRDLNRYRDVNPFDHSRIILTRGPCNYINASLVKVDSVDRMYILTQGPLSNTISHFWAMVWEQNCKAIVMLNNIIEKNQIKCITYWPVRSEPGGSIIMDDVQLSVELIEEVQQRNYMVRTMNLTDLVSKEVRTVVQYHYTTWPDFGVPSTSSDFLHFLDDIRRTGALGPGTYEKPIGPAVIHCSAGIGRSGTFCIVDTSLLLLEREERVNVKELVLEMRRHRMGLIQTAEQLRFSYLAIIEGAQLLNLSLTRSEDEMDQNGVDESSSDDESSEDLSDEEESASAEEVEEDEDVVSNESPGQNATEDNCSSDGIVFVGYSCDGDESEDVPPPIPPRGESLVFPPPPPVAVPDSPIDYDRPLPQVPPRPKRSRAETESEASATEEEPVAGDNRAADTSASETDKKRRKDNDEEEGVPRTAESDNGHVRQRRQERVEKTQQLIANIKEKQKDQEKNAERQEKLRASSKWLGIGVGIIVLACVGFRYFQA